MHPLIFDTSAIFNFVHRADLSPVIERLSRVRKLCISLEVQREMSQLKVGEHLLKQHFTAHKAWGVNITPNEIKRLSTVISATELSVILLASDLGGTAVLDEPIARAEAAKTGISVSGILELLRECVQENWCSDSDCMEIINRLYAAGFRTKKPNPNQTFSEYCGGFKSKNSANSDTTIP